MNRLLASSLVVSALAIPTSSVSAEASSTLKLRILETTDIHVNVVNYDYYKDAPTNEFGLAKTATLIKNARTEVKNSLLFDNGDLLQGNPLGDYMAKIKPLKAGEVHPVYKAMNQLNYDMGNIGNHEFNYGLEFLDNSLKGAKFPYVNANVYVDDKDNNPDNDKNFFTPYRILEKKFVDEAGKEVTLKVGVIGFVPPQVMQWDKANLEGKVIAKDIVETANKFVPKMKAEGADIIVAIPHSGFEAAPSKGNDENAVYYLSQVEGIDAILFGHSHKVFPGTGFDNIKGVDAAKGTINGKASVMPGFWGDHLGVIDLTLQQVDGKWSVVDTQSQARPIYDKTNKKSLADADQAILDAVKHEHEGTLEYVRGPVGKTTAPINSYFALVNDDPSIQIVTNAQKWYVEQSIKGTEYDGIPVLSAGAPFKAGGRSGASYYTDIPAGTIAVKNVSDLYIYPNTLKAVLLKGSEVKEWLEMAAGQFNQIDPNKTEEQSLINNDFPTYNYDVIDGVSYQIDVTQPAKYDAKGNVVNANSSRIKNLTFQGKAIDPEQKFVVVTNNYRASGGGNFPGLKGQNIIVDSPDENRQVVIGYISSLKTVNPAADNNWSFAPINGKANVVFETSPNAQAAAEKLGNIKFISTLESGFGKYSIDLSKGQASTTPTTPAKPATPATPAPVVKKDPKELIAVRTTADSLGIAVAYDKASRTVTLTKGTAKVAYVLGAAEATVNGKKVAVNAKLDNSKLYLPAGLIQDTFGVVVK
ncbi:bifunctional 2',3'-cyclic-nucleotide 2'-phosphodiesterase/3'-nucleotidase [Brevibacillus dissolubilis]|uniref:bifunctional 2',3'-cyclic-nucleotide 2'-phosphodiesterase/3'-nucleotidase n=1 Tax=Brevibacillus dissolubilis TaxID=1844116 RepID=UPI0011176F3D|nr:bifunctional 2',3'-cyclic-nucleotide 2'-phosphodiesterase/3'-nucleotidase [Brevibacillus dissolubilis]